MERKKERSDAAKRKQRQEREESKKKLPKLDSFFTKPLSATVPSTAETSFKSAEVIVQNTTINAPAENDYLDASVQPTVDESSISTSSKVLEISNDLVNYINKKLSDTEKRLILDKGPLKPPGPFPKDPHQDNRSFSETYYVTTSQYGPVDRFCINKFKLRGKRGGEPDSVSMHQGPCPPSYATVINIRL
ncbi:hypothetical protein HF086_006811 [Spodoptera exigua]|uniref:Uncharacterized protein n=1 Tax=Spodoptera exigua TaxID=7107 RepID=A0A922M150_SPOEX|nr:hypothetical protein HF086_006811 [Spodoptera exigua]